MATKATVGQIKSVDDYLRLPYSFKVYQDESADGPYWAAEVVELKGCAGDGATAEEAIASARANMRDWLQSVITRGLRVPEPGGGGDFSGKFQLRLPKSLHRELATRADTEGSSLNAWAALVLARYGT